MKTLWGGRFEKGADPELNQFSYSLAVDRELFSSEIEVNKAYAKMLAKAGLLTDGESKEILKGLTAIEKNWDSGKLLEVAGQCEDIHSFIQSELEGHAGVLGKKIHTGRSRNDLVVTSTRLYLRKRMDCLLSRIGETQKALVYLAQKAGEIIIPGMTHLRKAQPVLLAHHLLAYVEMLEEDAERLRDARKRVNVLVLGSAALAGSSLPLDQVFLAKELGFEKVAANSMAATSDRAFMTEVLAALSILWMHLSRMAEDFILWNSEPFNLIELDDAFATGSSLMPQKKNPDVFELVRGRSGVIFGHLMSLLTVQKGLPLCYNRDLQEDKPGLFDALAKTRGALKLLPLVLKTVKFKSESAALLLLDDTLFATDLLEYLVRKGVAFSDAHQAVGKLVAAALKSKKPLRALDLKIYQRQSKKFEADVFKLFSPLASVKAKQTAGSTHPDRVQTEIRKWEKKLRDQR